MRDLHGAGRRFSRNEARRRREPLVDLRFFRSLPFSGATVTAVSAMGALGGFLFLNTLYLQEVRGYRPLVADCRCTLSSSLS